jgi:hypothetical protein
MHWDAKKRRYVDEHGHVIPPSEVRQEVIDYVDTEKEKAQKQAEKLLAATITAAAFFHFMNTKIKAWHDVAGSIAYGGKAQIDRERKARIDAKIASELTYLQGFQQEIKASFAAAKVIAESVVVNVEIALPTKSVEKRKLTDHAAKAALRKSLTRALNQAAPSNAESIARQVVADAVEDVVTESVIVDGTLAADLIGGTIENRAGMYAESLYATFQNNVSAREFDEGVTLGRRVLEEGDNCDDCISFASEEFVPLDELPEIGDSVCGSRCRCEFEFQTEGQQFLTSDIFSGTIQGQDAYGGSVEIQ